MRNFLKNLLLIILGMFLGLFFLLLISIIILFSLSNKKLLIENNSYLVLDFYGEITEKPLSEFSFLIKNKSKIELLKYLKAIEYASFDDRIEGIVINGDLTFYDKAHIEEIHSALLKFKNKGKKIYAWISNGEYTNYYFCSIADKIYMPKTSSAYLTLKGYWASIPYFKDCFDKIGIEFEVIHIGKYKGAYENFNKNAISEDLKKSHISLLESIFYQDISNISRYRGITINQIEELISNGKTIFMTPSEAKKYKFIDDFANYEEFTKNISNNFKSISIFDYSNMLTKKEKENKIAIIFIEGIISNYFSSSNKFEGDIAGAKSLIEDINKIKNDKKIKGVIVRVNSPGGSSLGSELILQAINDLKKNKPVYFSFGPVAASGGYYISSMGDKIFANKSTITGSIGVVSLFFNYKSLSDKLGINFETIKKFKFDDFYSNVRKPTNEEIEIMRKSMEEIYEEFTDHIIEGRKINKNIIPQVAEGRVWSGIQALEYKLVDKIGGLINVIEELIADNNITNYSIECYPKPVDFFTELFEESNVILNKNFLNFDESIKKILNFYLFYKENGIKPCYLLYPYFYTENLLKSATFQ